ncbi:hypothetical protein NP590_15535 [Methylomonas sp. SURF-2]|uniref:Uncharacterized protein n=1 Tax=Methylomonas subterranea TaxID=2952225 RepID=A0ABT1TJ76_9GAMM|nr:hypothetical protein [Methylomonas sp. SURF-2]MCQ8105523.1 hypothetical protein [Methylomonas sp. SURF-2]
MMLKNVDIAGLDSIFAAHGDLQRDWSRQHLLLDAFFSSANRFDEIVRGACEEMLARELVLDYRPTCAAPSFEEIQRCYDDLAKHLNKARKPRASIRQISRTWLFGLAQRSANLLGAVGWLVTESAREDLAEDTNPAPAVVPDFSHRLSPIGGMNNTLALADTVNMASEKAGAILKMLSNHFAKDDDEDRPRDEVIYYALQAISDEVQDIKSLVEAFHNAAVLNTKAVSHV